MKKLFTILILISIFVGFNSFEVTYRMRNVTTSSYEYITQEDSIARPTILPDNPSDSVDQDLTAIVINRF